MKTTKYLDGMEVEILLETDNDVVASPTVGETDYRFFADPAQIQEGTEKVQEKYSKGTEKGQERDSEGTVKHYQKYGETGIENARKHLPERPTVALEISMKWFIIETLQQDIYKEGEISDFAQLVSKLEKGEIEYCPRPQWRAVNQLLEKSISLNQLKRTLKLFIEYKNAYSPTGFWLWIENGLNGIDRMLNFLIRFV